MSNTAQDQARAQVASICAMVAALDVNYDRLEELRDEKEDYESDPRENPRPYEVEHPDEQKELTELEDAAGDCTDEDDARQRIEEDALSVEVRSGWQVPGDDVMSPEEFRIVLCTGGPHVELVGDLDDNKQPSRVRVIYKDWGESGELFDFDRNTVLRYCSVFYFGE